MIEWSWGPCTLSLAFDVREEVEISWDGAERKEAIVRAPGQAVFRR